ncbi:hypothetical protein WN51_02767 [Melipona quadrifasciata]|uniref:Uncharacterized protein n=1 Tax=Melipona quadrifasciata TaxID=166423 RepID=A0A0N0U769_9HYME|nr:hypothetical protein WN51_02767 [Melipona quadrifasciata]
MNLDRSYKTEAQPKKQKFRLLSLLYIIVWRLILCLRDTLGQLYQIFVTMLEFLSTPYVIPIAYINISAQCEIKCSRIKGSMKFDDLYAPDEEC